MSVGGAMVAVELARRSANEGRGPPVCAGSMLGSMSVRREALPGGLSNQRSVSTEITTNGQFYSICFSCDFNS